MLISHLPVKESWFLRAVAPDAVELSQFGAAENILANLFDITARTHFQNPKPYPRPADAIQQRRRDEERRLALLAQNQRIKTAGEGS